MNRGWEGGTAERTRLGVGRGQRDGEERARDGREKPRISDAYRAFQGLSPVALPSWTRIKNFSKEYIGTDPSEPRGTGCCLDQQKNTSLRGRYTGGSGTWASPPSLPQVPESIARHDSPSAGAATLTEAGRRVSGREGSAGRGGAGQSQAGWEQCDGRRGREGSAVPMINRTQGVQAEAWEEALRVGAANRRETGFRLPQEGKKVVRIVRQALNVHWMSGRNEAGRVLSLVEVEAEEAGREVGQSSPLVEGGRQAGPGSPVST
ncbi:hypothetical protein O3P69_008791 [Scylla paramamosain]|uniref:Uncharacterized protein n=1 Tax=Scylla paramamosain TaxID=85552 RepID=A0AAW0TNM0_SCYPA